MEEKVKKPDYRVTRWKAPTEIIETIAGDMYYQQWCENELNRLGADNHFIVYRKRDTNREICIKRREE